MLLWLRTVQLGKTVKIILDYDNCHGNGKASKVSVYLKMDRLYVILVFSVTFERSIINRVNFLSKPSWCIHIELDVG